VQNCANTKSNALCCSKQDRSKLYGLRESFTDLFSYLAPPGLASSFPFDRNFSKEASFSNKFSRDWPLKNLCQHTFHQITTPPRASPHTLRVQRHRDDRLSHTHPHTHTHIHTVKVQRHQDVHLDQNQNFVGSVCMYTKTKSENVIHLIRIVYCIHLT